MTTATKYERVEDVAEANRRAGYHFFDADTMRFFNSRADDELYGGRWFVTSEKFMQEPRAYTVREALTTGAIETFGEVGAFPTLNRARTFARNMARATADAPRCRNCDKRLCFDAAEAKWGQPDDPQANRYGYGPLCRYCA